MSYQKGSLIYEGKAKRVFAVENHGELVWQEFKDSMTALNGARKVEYQNKGPLNRDISTSIFKYLAKAGVDTHWIESPGERDMVTRKLEMIPLEVVVRNKAAGSLCKRLGIAEKTLLNPPLVEFFYKNDKLNDPFISDDQALMLKAARSIQEIQKIKTMALQVNEHLIHFFKTIGLELVDFKVEMGRTSQGDILLADEISPDSCRLWDLETGERKDKDRFRLDLGDVIESYTEIRNRIWERKL